MLSISEQELQSYKRARIELEKELASRQTIGMILQEAGLVSAFQIEEALQNQTNYPQLRIGEILALKGWIKLETADFFAYKWSVLVKKKDKLPLGYYLKEAGLLDEDQIRIILSEQEDLRFRLGITLRFGAIAIIKGLLKQETVDFFLKYLFPDKQSETPYTRIESVAQDFDRSLNNFRECARLYNLTLTKKVNLE